MDNRILIKNKFIWKIGKYPNIFLLIIVILQLMSYYYVCTCLNNSNIELIILILIRKRFYDTFYQKNEALNSFVRIIAPLYQNLVSGIFKWKCLFGA